jgi:5'-nucleotidase
MISDKFWVQTFTGKVFHPLEPQTQEIEIADIAHALSMQCRFNGHCLVFYSVAEHCLRVSKELPDQLALWGLLHDAAEAYLSDLPRPVKRQIPVFGQIEDRLLKVIIEYFGLSWPMPEEVARFDTILLATEARDLMLAPPKSWELDVEPLSTKVEPLTARQAELAYLARFEELRAR